MLFALLGSTMAHAADITVASIEALREAVSLASPGDTLTLAPGAYLIDRTLTLAPAGTPEAPITLRAPGATIVSTTSEAIKVTGPHWHLDGMYLSGGCATDDACEHAIHIVGAADGTWVHGSTLVDFNAQIKANGEVVAGTRAYPDDVRIEGNDLHDTRARQTANPVTKIDVVGGRRWVVEANRIADFQKAGGDTISYAAFLKGASREGTFARNLVVCSERLAGGVRVGLSLGGGGTDPAYCEDGACASEHIGGRITDNLVARCDDVGIYLNKATDTLVRGNTLYATSGIDVRFAASTATLTNNLLDGRVRERDGGTATLGENLTQADLGAMFVAPETLDFTLTDGSSVKDMGEVVVDAGPDFCGTFRDGPHDLGAIEYVEVSPCDTRVTHPLAADTGDVDTGGVDTGSPDTGSADTADTADTAEASSAQDDTAATPLDPGSSGCGCGAPSRGSASLLLVPLALARRRKGRVTTPRTRRDAPAPSV